MVPVLVGATPASAGTVTTTNSCTNNAQAGTSALDITVSGAATPDPIILGSGDITLSGATFGIDVPSTVLLAGYGLGLLTTGTNNIPATVNVDLLATNTAQGTQTVPPLNVVGVTTISDPTPSNKTSGDETATPLAVSATIPDMTWTPTGGPIALSLGDSSTSALVAGGIITVTFECTPGTPGPTGCGPAPLTACTTTIPVPAVPFDTVTVNAPPTPPVCTNESTSVGITQSIPINLVDNCTDVNSDIDLTTFTIEAPGAGEGSITGADGVYTYTAPPADPGAPVTLNFTVTDAAAQVSNTGVLSITVLANSCDATTSACSLTEIVVQPVVGTTMTLDKVAGLVQMSAVVLNGEPQVSTGSLQDLTVTNARGTAAGWSVSGFVTDLGAAGGPTITLPTGQTIPACSAAGSLGLSSAANRLCIPGDNMGWDPEASIAHDVIFGDVAQVVAGAADAADAAGWLSQLIAAGSSGVDGLGGLQSVNELCSSPADRSGGTFACDATLFLGVPASAGAGVYSGGLVLTLL